MDFGICLLSVIPMRTEPSQRVEMVNQLLFGDLVSIKDFYGDWLKVTSDFDGYEGWIDRKQIRIITKPEFDRLKSLSEGITPGLTNRVFNVTEEKSFQVLAGSSIRGIDHGGFVIDGLSFSYSGTLLTNKNKPLPSDVITYARSFLNAPYQWGGRSPFGIDCSGLVQVCFKMAGVRLLRDASQQSMQGQLVSFPEEALPGDLAFFDNEEGSIVHVGILIEPGVILHASGKVRTDQVDHQGIYDEKAGLYTHRLRLIKRVI